MPLPQYCTYIPAGTKCSTWNTSPFFRLSLGLPLARQRRRVLLDTLPEAALHSRREGHTRLAKLVPQFVRRGHGLLPSLASAVFEQVSLLRLPLKRRCLHAQQAHLLPLAPVLAKQSAHLLEDFRIELRGCSQRVRPRDGGKIFVAQLELESASMQSTFPQAPSHHLGEPHQRGLKLLDVRSVVVISVFVADGFGSDLFADFSIEPSAGVFAAGFAGQRQSPL